MNDQQHRADCPHRELAVGWALHALEPADESPIAVHLPHCPICTSTATDAEEVGATLALSVPQANPSAELEWRVLSVTAAKCETPVLAPVPPPRPARHIAVARFWRGARIWLRPPR